QGDTNEIAVTCCIENSKKGARRDFRVAPRRIDRHKLSVRDVDVTAGVQGDAGGALQAGVVTTDSGARRGVAAAPGWIDRHAAASVDRVVVVRDEYVAAGVQGDSPAGESGIGTSDSRARRDVAVAPGRIDRHRTHGWAEHAASGTRDID